MQQLLDLFSSCWWTDINLAVSVCQSVEGESSHFRNQFGLFSQLLSGKSPHFPSPTSKNRSCNSYSTSLSLSFNAPRSLSHLISLSSSPVPSLSLLYLLHSLLFSLIAVITILGVFFSSSNSLHSLAFSCKVKITCRENELKLNLHW